MTSLTRSVGMGEEKKTSHFVGTRLIISARHPISGRPSDRELVGHNFSFGLCSELFSFSIEIIFSRAARYHLVDYSLCFI